MMVCPRSLTVAVPWRGFPRNHAFQGFPHNRAFQAFSQNRDR